MAIDPNISLGFEFGDKSPGLTGYRQGLTLRDAARQSQMQEAEYGYQQEQRAQQAETDRVTGEAVGGMVPPELRELARVNPQSAMKLWEFKKGAAAEQIEAVKQQQGALANAAAGLRNVPYAQRRQALQQMAPQLEAMGVSGDMIGGFDPSDAAIDGIIAQSIGVVKVLEFEDKAQSRKVQMRGQDIQMRGQDISASNAAAARAVTLRGQDISRANTTQLTGGGAKPVKMTEGQAKDGFNAKRMVGANAILDGFENTPGFRPGATSIASMFGGTKSRQYESAKEEWADSLIRLTTGAAATKDEINSAKAAYFPDPRDDGQTIAQKAAMRARVTQDALQRSGPGAAGVSAPAAMARATTAAGGAASGGGNRVIQFDKNGKRVR